MDIESAAEHPSGSEIAVIGMSCRFPGAANLDRFWKNLRDGVESVSFLPDEELAPSIVDPADTRAPGYVKAASILDGVDLFDAAFFGYSPKEAEVMDPQHRVFLECAWEALEDAGYDPTSYGGSIGVFGGSRSNTYLFNIFTNREKVGVLGAIDVGLGNDPGFLTSRVSYKLDLKGPSYTVHTACSTSLVAVHLACQSLLIDECQIALAGGVAINIPQKTGYLYQPGGILSPDGHCRAFDEKAQGTVFGSGVGIAVLKRLTDALADRDTIYAVIKGSAINNDGAYKASFTAPSVLWQAEVIAEALACADVAPETISYVEAHGTGTLLGDPIEIRALTKAFRIDNHKKSCALGSVKTNIGHLDAAAGIAGLIKTVLALEHKQLPPSLHYETPNPHIKFNETPFYVNTELTEWHSESSPRRAGVSSFGVGGTNAHVIIEEPPAIKFASASRPYQLLVLSARTSQALEAATDKLSSFLGQKPSSDLADIAYTLSIGRKVFNYRRTCIVRDAESAAKALALDERQSLQTAYQETCDRSVVFMFPGQGSQYINMGKDLYATEDVFRKEVDDCSSQLISLMGRDLRMLLYQAPGTEGQADKELISTAIAQPALFAIEYALGKLWMSWGVKPKAMIGHSVGEYTAACLAGVMSLEDALKLVCLRGRMMQALPRGVMLALELEEKETASLIKGLPVDIAAVNGPRACVVSGEKSVIEDFRKILKDQGIVNRLLRTSHAFHSRTMNEIVETFAEEVKRVNLSRPEIPFVSNVSGKIIEDTEAVDPFYWGRHLRETVKFWDGVKELNRAYLPVFLEVGPGRTLTTLAQERSSDEMKRTTVGSMKHPLDARNDNECLLEALGNLWLEGARINWMNFYDGQNRRRVRVPTYPFERQRFWIDPGSPAGESQKRQIVGKKADLSEWFYLPSWKRTLSLSPADPSVQKLNQLLYLVFDDGGNLADSIAQSLECGGSRVIRVRKGDLYRQVGNDVYLIEPQRKEDYEELIRQVSESGRGRSDRIVVLHFWSITAREEQTAGVDYFRKIQNLGFYSLLFLAQTLVEKDIAERIELNICSDRIFSVEGAETCIPEKAPITAVCKVLPQENPKIFCRCIDLVIPLPSSPEEVWIKAQILSEIFSAGSDMMIAYRGDRRLLQSYEPVCLDQAIRPRRLLRENGVYLITGGLGGVGLILAEYLALTVKAKVVLVGRSPFPEKCDWAEWLTAHDESDPTSKKILKLQNLERQDAEVMVVSADVADKERMKLVISEIYERFNCLNGVLHAAGTTSGPSVFTSFTEIGIFESELQFRPKVYGTYVLKEILRDRDLDFCMLFSSNASVLGGLGLSAYSAANSFMDAFTDSRAKRSGMTWISASWDEWPEETKRYVGFRTSIDQYSMAIEESCEAFRRVATMMSGGHIIVSTGDLHTRMKLWVGRDSMQATSSLTGDDSAVAHSRPALKSEYLAPRNEPEQIIAEICGRLLGIESIGVDDNFFSLGGHSLLAVKVVSRINDRFCVDLPLAKFFASPTVAELAQVVAEIQGQQNIDEAIDLLHEVAQMTDDEVNVNLSRRSQLG